MPAVAEVIGIDHIYLSVSSLDRAEPFYDRVLVETLGFQAAGLEASAPQLFPEYAPDYVAVFVDDPDGVRLEVTNFRAERRQRMEHWSAGI